MNSAESLISSFFVYGTLCRGQCLANRWPAEPERVVPAWVFGELFGREDYPAMRPGRDRIAGECWQFDQDVVPKVIRTVDAIEGTNQPNMANLYDRVLMEVFLREHAPSQTPDVGGGIEAYGYHYASDPVEHGFRQILPRVHDDFCCWPS